MSVRIMNNEISRIKQEDLPFVSVIVLNYNGKEHLNDCFSSLEALKYPKNKLELIMVDNASSDGSVRFMKETFSGVTIIQNSENLGFAKGNNVAIRRSKGDYIALLNNDTKVHKDWLIELVKAIKSDKEIGACASKILMFYEGRLINSAGGGMTISGLGFDIGLYELDKGQYDTFRYVLFPCAAAALIKRSLLDEIGLFDELFFMYHDDVDLGYRIWLGGHKIVYVPTAIVYHKYGATSDVFLGTLKKLYYGERNALRSILKNYEMQTLLKISPQLFKHYVSSIYLIGNFSLRGILLQTYYTALKIMWNIYIFPDTVKERKKVQRLRVVSDNDLKSLISDSIPLIVMPDYHIQNKGSVSDRTESVTVIEMGKNDKDLLGYGWYPLEATVKEPKITYRWTREEAVAYLHLSNSKGALCLDILAIPETIKEPVSVTLYLDNKVIGEIVLTKDGWHHLCFDLNSDNNEIAELKIEPGTMWKPAKIFNNQDMRTLGIGVRTIEWKNLG